MVNGIAGILGKSARLCRADGNRDTRQIALDSRLRGNDGPRDPRIAAEIETVGRLLWIPACAGMTVGFWIPACAGMTVQGPREFVRESRKAVQSLLSAGTSSSFAMAWVRTASTSGATWLAPSLAS